jgi:hypothetical protein
MGVGSPCACANHTCRTYEQQAQIQCIEVYCILVSRVTRKCELPNDVKVIFTCLKYVNSNSLQVTATQSSGYSVCLNRPPQETLKHTVFFLGLVFQLRECP